MSSTGLETPNPGTNEALDAGCTCPVLDNRHGLGIPMGDKGEVVFWYTANCPIHMAFVDGEEE